MQKYEVQRFWVKMSGLARSPLSVQPKHAMMGTIGGFAVILALGLLTEFTPELWIMAPFGASCVLVFGLWDAPLSQPRNVIGGHLISTFAGLALYHLLGSGPVVIAAGVDLAIGLMMLTKTTHPPAGADPIVVMMAGAGWSFLLAPVLIGSVVIVALALLINNLDRNRRYPTFWL